MKFLKRAESGPVAGGAPRMADGGSWAQGLPALVEFLTETKWDDGTPRAVGSLTLFVDEGLWKACLSDKDAGRVAFVSGQTPTDVFQAAEKGLTSSSLDWRQTRGQAGKKR